MTPQQYNVIRNALEAQIIRARSLQQNKAVSELTAAQIALTNAQMQAEAQKNG